MRRFIQWLPINSARSFLATETAGGVVMLFAAAIALLLANSAASAHYQHWINVPLVHGLSLTAVTKDALMAIFFFAVGMELKYEMREGSLSAKGQKLLPLIAALGGIALPAMIYLAITHTSPQYRAGWAIPTATDIAFALCVLRLAGPALPQPAKIFLLAIAIYDDLAAILIIAMVYAAALNFTALLIAAMIIALMLIANRHLTNWRIYSLLGIALWFAMHASGIHPTVAGLVTGLLIPLRSKAGTTILRPWLHRLHPYVAFLILPLFAFTAAGTDLRTLTPADMLSLLPIGIAAALVIGKSVGITIATFACVKCGIAKLPSGVTKRMIFGIALLAGIGFTMSLFIGSLAFPDPHLVDLVKLGVLAGSLISAGFGVIYLRYVRMA